MEELSKSIPMDSAADDDVFKFFKQTSSSAAKENLTGGHINKTFVI
jgi:hypothetical protein